MPLKKYGTSLKNQYNSNQFFQENDNFKLK